MPSRPQARDHASPNKLPSRVWLTIEVDCMHEDHAIAASDVQALLETTLQAKGYKIHSIAVAGRPLGDTEKRWRTALPQVDAEARARAFGQLTPLQQQIVMHCGNAPQTLHAIFTPHRGTHTTEQVAKAIVGLQAAGWLVAVEYGQHYTAYPKPNVVNALQGLASTHDIPHTSHGIAGSR